MCILHPWESKILRFCWGAISLAHANADDLVIPIKARPSGICYQDFHVITMSDYSLKKKKRKENKEKSNEKKRKKRNAKKRKQNSEKRNKTKEKEKKKKRKETKRNEKYGSP